MRMRRSLTASLLILINISLLYSQELDLRPSELVPVPDINLVELETLASEVEPEYYDYFQISQADKDLLAMVVEDEVLGHFYSSACSWYCGGFVQSLQASSILSERYNADNAHDFSVTTAWVEGADGDGEGEFFIVLFFRDLS